MKQLIKKEVNEKIRRILKIKVFDIQSIKLKTFNIRTFLWMSSIYALVWLIPMLRYEDLSHHLQEDIILTLGYMFWVYLPEIVIYIYDFIVKRCKLENKIVIKNIRILIMILSYVYLVLFGILLFVVVRGAMLLFGD